MVESTDEQLARAAMTGDREAFGALAVRLRVPLIAYLAGVLDVPPGSGPTRHDAEEIAQDAFLAAWEKLTTLRDPARVRGWIYRIVHNLAMDRIRKPQPASLLADLPEPIDDGKPRRIAPLIDALAQLSERHRDVIARKHFNGATCEAIAEQLDIPPGTVRSRLSRAYARLRSILASQEAEETAGSLDPTKP